MKFFANFDERLVSTERGPIYVRVGGAGPPLLLLHGYPQSHMMWHAAAPMLARHFEVVAADLAGYGASHHPMRSDDHSAHSKRAMAVDQVQAMESLGHRRFAVAGHDRGGRVAYRMALDHPDRVSALAVLDIVPTAEVWARADATMALGYWHWTFLAQPPPLAELLISAAPDAYFDHHVRRMGIGSSPDHYPPALITSYRQLLHDSLTVEAICEDYRAGATIDRELDEADRGRPISCPVLALWARRGALPGFYGDVLALWRPWAEDLRGRELQTTHFIVEDAPDEVSAALIQFLRGRF